MRRTAVIVGIIALVVLLVIRERRLQGDGSLRVHILDVGQGDAILMVSPTGSQILVDGGPDDAVMRQLGIVMPFLDRTIELVILSHPDADHLAGLVPVLERYDVGRVLLSGVIKDTYTYQRFLRLIAGKKIPVTLADPSHDIALSDGVLLDVLWPPPGTAGTVPKEVNDTSVVVKASFSGASILLTGDISEDAEARIVASGQDLHSTVLKVPHHGSKTSSSTGFLLAVHPEAAVMSVATVNRYGHPTPQAMARYAMFGIPVRSTADEGMLTLHMGLPSAK